jgi:hypothetical protein
MSRIEVLFIVLMSFFFGFMTAVCVVDVLEEFKLPFSGKVFERVYSQDVPTLQGEKK